MRYTAQRAHLPVPRSPLGSLWGGCRVRFGPLVFKDKKTCAGQVGPYDNFQIDAGGGFAPGTPLQASDSSAHVYLYPLIGTGAPAQFRFFDPYAYDNYGVFRIITRLATGSDCAGTGAGLFGFGSVLDCESALGAAPPQPIPVTAVPPVLGAVRPVVGQSTSQAAKLAACKSRRAFTIRLKEPRTRRLKSANVYLGTKRVAKAFRRRSDHRLVARIMLKNRPLGDFTFRIRAARVNGRRITGFRSYRTCSPHGPNRNIKTSLL